MTWLRLAAFIDADVHLLPPDEGGRRTPIASGYRCNCWIGHTNGAHRVYNDATIHLLAKYYSHCFSLGECAAAQLRQL